MVLAILAAISLSAVIGEDGIIFQAKDTKNMIENETQYDSEQLASMQGDLRDNSIYSGIGLVPGTDLGGNSEGGEHGSGGTGNTGGTGGNTHGGSTTGGGGGATTGGMLGEEAVPPTITVLEGEEIAASFFRSDVTVQIATTDKTLKIKYVLTTTVDEISKELYPSGLIREMDIENGGTLTFTRAGEYTITAATYDLEGRKSNSTIMWLKIDKGGITGAAGVEVSCTSGIGGDASTNGWYTSNVTYRVLGTDTGSSRVTYRVRGVAYDNGYIGGQEINAGPEHNAVVDTGEVDIPNGTTFRIAVDGEFTITAYTYDAGGSRLSTSPVINMKRDATRPFITRYTGEQVTGSGFRVDVNATDYASKLTAGNSYTYRYKEATDLGNYISTESNQTTKTYTGLAQNKTYDMYVAVIDQAGNIVASDVISKPSLWISNTPTAGETATEGARSYYRSNVQLKMRGQDSNNVNISKVTYEVIGTTTGAGSIAERTGLTTGTAVSGEVDITDMTAIKTITLAADGNWTVKVNTYNKENQKVSTNVYDITRDTVGPNITSFTTTFPTVTTCSTNVTASDVTSPLSTSGRYTYYVGATQNTSTTSTTSTLSNAGPSKFSQIKVVVKDKAGNTSEKLASVDTQTAYLVDVVSVGDYVAYEAGTWSETKADPTTNGTFGGYTAGTDKGTSVVGTNSGWRVLSKEGGGATGTVTLVSAGCPAKGYYGNSGELRTAMISNMNLFAGENFASIGTVVNTRCMDISDKDDQLTADLVNVGCCYWLASNGGDGVHVSGSGNGIQARHVWANSSGSWYFVDSTLKTYWTAVVETTMYGLRYVEGSNWSPTTRFYCEALNSRKLRSACNNGYAGYLTSSSTTNSSGVLYGSINVVNNDGGYVYYGTGYRTVIGAYDTLNGIRIVLTLKTGLVTSANTGTDLFR